MVKKKPEYPLREVLLVKERRVEEAEKVVLQKKQALEQEEEKLKKQEAIRDQAKQHKQDKLNQLRDELDHGTTSPKIQQMKAYLKVVEERLKVEEKKVNDQKEKVELAKKELEAARHELNLKRLEVDKLKTHRETWEKEVRKEMELLEEREMDEIGNIIYGMKKKNSN